VSVLNSRAVDFTQKCKCKCIIRDNGVTCDWRQGQVDERNSMFESSLHGAYNFIPFLFQRNIIKIM
jgi:hypothetical protein